MQRLCQRLRACRPCCPLLPRDEPICGAITDWDSLRLAPLRPVLTPLPPGGDRALSPHLGAAGPAAESGPDAVLCKTHSGQAGGDGAADRYLPGELRLGAACRRQQCTLSALLRHNSWACLGCRRCRAGSCLDLPLCPEASCLCTCAKLSTGCCFSSGSGLAMLLPQVSPRPVATPPSCTSICIPRLQRDAAMAGLLLDRGACTQHAHLLDIIRPWPGSLFASKVRAPRLKSRLPLLAL